MDKEAQLKRLYGMDKEADLGETLSGAWDGLKGWARKNPDAAAAAGWAGGGGLLGWLLAGRRGILPGALIGGAGRYAGGKARDYWKRQQAARGASSPEAGGTSAGKPDSSKAGGDKGDAGGSAADALETINEASRMPWGRKGETPADQYAEALQRFGEERAAEERDYKTLNDAARIPKPEISGADQYAARLQRHGEERAAREQQQRRDYGTLMNAARIPKPEISGADQYAEALQRFGEERARNERYADGMRRRLSQKLAPMTAALAAGQYPEDPLGGMRGSTLSPDQAIRRVQGRAGKLPPLVPGKVWDEFEAQNAAEDRAVLSAGGQAALDELRKYRQSQERLTLERIQQAQQEAQPAEAAQRTIARKQQLHRAMDAQQTAQFRADQRRDQEELDAAYARNARKQQLHRAMDAQQTAQFRAERIRAEREAIVNRLKALNQPEPAASDPGRNASDMVRQLNGMGLMGN